MKLGQLIEYNKRNIFLKKLSRKMRQGDDFETLFYFLKKPDTR